MSLFDFLKRKDKPKKDVDSVVGQSASDQPVSEVDDMFEDDVVPEDDDIPLEEDEPKSSE